MNKDINLKDLWQKQQVSQPNIEDIFSKVRQFNKSNLRKLIILNLMLLATSAFIIFVWYYYQPQLVTTKIGIVLTIAAMFIYLFVQNKLLAVFNKIDNSLSNSEYLQNLIILKSRQQFLQTTMLSIYFIMLSAGLALYLYEYTSRMTMGAAIFAYGITGAWIIFNWLYLRPKIIKKQQSKLNELIAKVETLSKQLNNG
ncbi:hypothetical protein FAM09_29550 [Niastella caeni]|uniref:Uncharacterized protein n=1 Tax=Niastella caeni TaxID=2569763 RepID=A0A4S8H7D3_9BACT|nr:hypothetical protein [Niastella caeni]THU30748.1 hypothetical protein FAM09_29550 [Niastella caeni]